MRERKALSLCDVAQEFIQRISNDGVLCSVIDEEGVRNVLTLGWGQIGPFYHGNPVITIAVTPLRYSWRFLEAVPEFVICVPDDDLRPACEFCGTHSGREGNKFAAADLTPVPALHVRPQALLEAPINMECRIYTKIAPPHQILTPEHRERPLEEQHTIYFAEVLAIYGWQD